MLQTILESIGLAHAAGPIFIHWSGLMKLRRKKTRDGDWIVANDSTGGHAHFNTKFGADTIIFLLKNNIEPVNPYFVESKRRLLESRKHKKRKRKKQRYINK